MSKNEQKPTVAPVVDAKADAKTTKTGMPVSKHGFTTTSYLADAMRGLKRAAQLSPEILEKCNALIGEITPLHASFKTTRPKKDKYAKKTPEQIKAEIDALTQVLAEKEAAN